MRTILMCLSLLVIAGCERSPQDSVSADNGGVTIDIPSGAPANGAAENAAAAAAPAPVPAPPVARPKVAPPPAPATKGAPAAPAETNGTAAANELQDATSASPGGSEAPAPLAAPVIARTLQRIGYRCASVTGTSRASPGAGGESTYRVTCSSGEVYRARGKGRHLYFRPW